MGTGVPVESRATLPLPFAGHSWRVADAPDGSQASPNLLARHVILPWDADRINRRRWNGGPFASIRALHDVRRLERKALPRNLPGAVECSEAGLANGERPD